MRHKEEILKMFFLSVDNDIDSWYRDGSLNFISPNINGNKFIIDDFQFNNKIEFKTKDDFIFNIGRYYIFYNTKLWIYVQKIKKHLKNKNEEVINKKEDIILNSAISEMSTYYIKEVRKEKLKNINTL